MQIPFCVVTGWIMGQPMDLTFHLFETATLFITVIVVAFLLQVCNQTPLIISGNINTSFTYHFRIIKNLKLIHHSCKRYVFLQEGTSNYFKGLMLILCYLIVAASFFVHVDPPLSGEYQL